MRGKFLVLFAVSAVGLWGQRVTDRRSANIRGGGGDGKCTIEVMVDGVAQVEIRGNDAQIRTVSGAPASFRRFECNQEMPNRPLQFRFQGVDGRGRQNLVNSPENNGQAIIRIEDQQGGSEGYTFDIFWNGGNYSGGRGNGGFGGGRNGGGFGRGNNGGGFGGGNVGNVPAVSADTGGGGSFNSRNVSGRVDRGFVNTSGQPTVGMRVNGRTISFFGNITNSSDREFQMNINGSSEGGANGVARFRMNGDRNEVEAITVQGNMNGRNFSGNFSR